MKKMVFALFATLAAPAIVSAAMAEHVGRKKIDGIDVLTYPTAIHDVVTILGALPAGTALALANRQNVSVAVLTAMMLDQGTTKEDKFAIAKRLEGVGATIQFTTRDQPLRIQARCLKKDLPLVLELMAEQLRSPAFNASEFERVRQQYIGELKNRSDDVQARSSEAFRRAVFPAGHPNYAASTAESLAAAQNVTLEQVKAFHHEHYGPSHMTLVLVGDVNLAQARSAMGTAFRGWKGGTDYLRDSEPATLSQPPEHTTTVDIPGKTSTVLTIGQATGLRDKDPESLALDVGTVVLGSGFTGRLMHAVRDQEGLTYGVGAQLANNVFSDGSWQVSGSFAPQLLDRGTISTQREVQRWWKDGITDQELAARKTFLVGSYQVGLATTSEMAGMLLNTVLTGRDLTWLDEYPKAIQTLTLEQVNTAIKRHLDPDKMVVIKAGTLPSS